MQRFLSVSLALGVIGIQALSADNAIPRATELLHSLPMVFEPNSGRWGPHVKFTARTNDYRVLLSARGAVFENSRHSVAVSPQGANPKAQISGDGVLPFRTSYFLGSRKEDWRRDVVNYSRVRYEGIYPGIDLVYYGSNNQLEYDFIVGAGADPGRIRLKFDGIQKMSVNPTGDLVVETPVGRFVQRKPLVYQELPGIGRQEIRGHFRLMARNSVGFAIEAYDRSRPLTIDPVLTYASLLGGSHGDRVTAAKVDASGDVYLAGYVGSGDITAPDSAFQTAASGDADMFIARINPTISGQASLRYFTYIGGSGTDIPTAMTLDGNGNLYLTGSTTSINFPLAGSGPQNSLNNGATQDSGVASDAFVMKFRPSESGQDAMLYSTYLGGGKDDVGNAVDVDSRGLIYVTGSTKSEDFPLTGANYQNIRYGPSDLFVVKVDPSLGSSSLVFSTYLGGELTDEGRSIVVAPSGAVFVAGNTFSTQFPQAGNQYRPDAAGGGDIFVVQMDLSKSGVDTLVYSTYLGGSGLDAVSRMALDSAGRLLLTGYTLSTDFPTTGDALQTRNAGIANAFVTRLDLKAPRASAVSYSTYLGGSYGDVAYDIATDTSGNVYLTGYTLSTDFPVTADALQHDAGGGIEAFVTKLKLADSGPSALLYSTYVGTLGVHVGYTLVVSPDGKIYVGGETSAPNINQTDSSFQNYFAGGQSDGFLLVFGTASQ